MADALDASEESLFNFDMWAVHKAFLQLIEDEQGPSGDVPPVMPVNRGRSAHSCNDIAWTTAYPQITNLLHEYYGDARVLKRHWASLIAYQENLIRNAANDSHHIAECDGYGDWYCGNGRSCCSNTPAGSKCPAKSEMGSFSYIQGLRAMAKMAAIMGNTSLSDRYSQTADRGVRSFHQAFYNPAFGA